MLLRFITGIPTTEKRYNFKFKDNKDYLKYKKTTNLLLTIKLREEFLNVRQTNTFLIILFYILYMKSPLSSKKLIVIDTCFWINIVHLDLQDFFLKYFKIIVVKKVEEEILDKTTKRIYITKDMKIYLTLKDNGLVILKDPKNISKSLINNSDLLSGELYSIALALENKILFASDDFWAIDFCNHNNIVCLNSVYFILFLYNKKEISKNLALKKLNLLKNRIKLEFILEGKSYLNNKK